MSESQQFSLAPDKTFGEPLPGGRRKFRTTDGHCIHATVDREETVGGTQHIWGSCELRDDFDRMVTQCGDQFYGQLNGSGFITIGRSPFTDVGPTH